MGIYKVFGETHRFKKKKKTILSDLVGDHIKINRRM